MARFRKLRTALGLRKKRPTDIWPYPGIVIGRHTYGVKPSSLYSYDETVRLNVGAFCSIALDVLFLSRADHPMHTASTYPMRSFGTRDGELVAKGPIVVGNDVWIGQRAMIMSGVTIGDGAVIGAGAIVTRDVAPYAIVAGNPARLIRYRFNDEVVKTLQELKWWDWSDDFIKEHIDDFDLPIEQFLARHHRG